MREYERLNLRNTAMNIPGTFLTVLLVLPGLAGAQRRPILPAPRDRADFARSFESSDPSLRGGAYGAAVAILTGEVRRQDLPADTMARDLVEIAVSSEVRHARTDAVATLIRSGQSDKLHPYPRAVDRLVEVHGRATDVGVRGVAIGGVVELANPERALGFLRPLAERGNPAFPTDQLAAINLIAQLNTTASVEFLRELDKRNVVRDEWAWGALKRHAAAGYRAPRERRPPKR